MAKIYRYKKKVTIDFTSVINLFSGSECVGFELCALGDFTYIGLPDGVELPSDQPAEIADTIELVVLTDELRTLIKLHSPHCKLIASRVVDKIRERYSIDDESAMQNKMIAEIKGIDILTESDRAKIAAAYAYFKECREWGQLQLACFGLA
jgi:hypothetical protein